MNQSKTMVSGVIFLTVIMAMMLMVAFMPRPAQAGIVDRQAEAEEIPFSENDKSPTIQPTIDHIRYFAKLAKCEGVKIAILYKQHSGYSHGTTFAGVCSYSNADVVSACVNEDSELLRKCYNKVVDKFSLEDKHPKVDISKPMPPVVDPSVLDLDGASSPTGVTRPRAVVN